MRKRNLILFLLCLSGCVSDDSSPKPKPPSNAEALCARSGFVVDTEVYSQCVATVLISERTQQEKEKQKEVRDTIGEDLAINICDAYARGKMTYPIKKRLSASASGDFEKTVDLAFSVDKPGTVFAQRFATCKLRGKELVDFSIK